MPYKIVYYQDEFIDKVAADAINQYNNFYGLNLTNSNIKIHIVRDRETYDKICGYKTDNRMRGQAKGQNVYLFDIDILEEVTGGYHKKDIFKYEKTIRHEIAHSFFTTYISGIHFPVVRLNEGMSIYLSGQLIEKTQPKIFNTFLDYWQSGGEGIYTESGFVVKYLIDNFGKDKLLELIKSLKIVKSKKEFLAKFKEIYGFELGYDIFK